MDEQLDALAGLVTEGGEGRSGEVGKRETGGGGVAEADQCQPEAEPPCAVAAHEPVPLQRAGEAVGGGAGQAGCCLQFGEPARSLALDGPQDGDRLVDYPDAGYNVHGARIPSQDVRRG